MAQSYKDLIVYQKRYKLALEIYKATKDFPKKEVSRLYIWVDLLPG
jgi:hypothetical protein